MKIPQTDGPSDINGFFKIDDYAVLDNKVVTQLYDEIGNYVVTIYDLYLTKLEERIAVIINAIHHNDTKTLSEAAHTLKGSSYNVGATQIAKLCSYLESMQDGVAARDQQQIIPQIEHAVTLLQNAMRIEINTYRDI